MNKIKKILYVAFPIAFWLVVWQVAYIYIGLDFVLPSIKDTFVAFFSNIITFKFWKSVFLSFTRIFFGFVLGVLMGCIFAYGSERSKLIFNILSPAMSVIKSTPVASFILVIWVMIGSSTVPIAIAVLMVIPIVWQNLINGFNSVDKAMVEVCDVFEVKGFKRFKILTLPKLVKFFIPAVLTSSGLAWKAGVAAEIISYTKNSIGKEISDSKNFFEGADLFAWTITVIIFSLLIEKVITVAVRRCNSYET